MAPTTTAARSMTPLARYLDVAVTDMGGLSTYLTVRRIPGPKWLTFEQIADELTTITGSPVNRVSVKTFADQFGIPDTRYIDGRKMPREVSAEAVDAYLDALPGEVRDDLLYREIDRYGAVPDRDVTAESETAAILADPNTMAAIAEGEADRAGHNVDQAVAEADNTI